jgi:sulfite reductase alpha subunit-like flavoprotein
MEAEERTNGTTREVAENRSLLVLYGTETGKSQEMAQEIGRAAEGLRFQTQVEEMDDVPLVSSTNTTAHHSTPRQSGAKTSEGGWLTASI